MITKALGEALASFFGQEIEITEQETVPTAKVEYEIKKIQIKIPSHVIVLYIREYHNTILDYDYYIEEIQYCIRSIANTNMKRRDRTNELMKHNTKLQSKKQILTDILETNL